MPPAPPAPAGLPTGSRTTTTSARRTGSIPRSRPSSATTTWAGRREQILTQAPGLAGNALTQHVLLGYDLLYLLRGAPAVLYGDEVGMLGSGGDQQARQDMFPTQVSDWQTQQRVGSTPVGKGSSLGITDNPIETELRALSSLRDAHPELSTGATVVRYAKDAVLVASRLDLATGKEAIVAFNNGATSATVSVAMASPPGKLTITIPPVSARAIFPAGIPKAGPAKPKLSTASDDLTSYYRLSATVAGGPVSVWFAIRRAGGAWQRVAADDSAPYRAFLEPGRFRKHERIQGVAVARGTDGSVAVSSVASFVPNP